MEAVDNDKWTPLHLAVSKGHEAVVRVLLDGGEQMHVLVGFQHYTNVFDTV